MFYIHGITASLLAMRVAHVNLSIVSAAASYRSIIWIVGDVVCHLGGRHEIFPSLYSSRDVKSPLSNPAFEKHIYIWPSTTPIIANNTNLNSHLRRHRERFRVGARSKSSCIFREYDPPDSSPSRDRDHFLEADEGRWRNCWRSVETGLEDATEMRSVHAHIQYLRKYTSGIFQHDLVVRGVNNEQFMESCPLKEDTFGTFHSTKS